MLKNMLNRKKRRKAMTFKEFFKLRIQGLDVLKRFRKDISPDEGTKITTLAWEEFNDILHDRIKHKRIKMFHDDVYPQCPECTDNEYGQVNWSEEGFLPNKSHDYYHLYQTIDMLQRTMLHYQILGLGKYIRTSKDNPCLQCGDTNGDCLIHHRNYNTMYPSCINFWREK
jgi:hypothetical protein